jgi:glycosyltransferase involved in cell wall biosynthesis
VSDKITLSISYGAVDHSLYLPMSEEETIDEIYVLIVGIMSKRKSPELIKKVINLNPKINFLIHGNSWESVWQGEEIPQNLRILEFDKNLHPQLMRRASCLLTLSELEGGPYPTLEALASGTPVVATRTGWNSEVIKRGNGILVKDLSDTIQISESLAAAIGLKIKVRNNNLLPDYCSWENVGVSLF